MIHTHCIAVFLLRCPTQLAWFFMKRKVTQGFILKITKQSQGFSDFQVALLIFPPEFSALCIPNDYLQTYYALKYTTVLIQCLTNNTPLPPTFDFITELVLFSIIKKSFK